MVDSLFFKQPRIFDFCRGHTLSEEREKSEQAEAWGGVMKESHSALLPLSTDPLLVFSLARLALLTARNRQSYPKTVSP